MLYYAGSGPALLPAFIFGGFMNVRISYTIDFDEIPEKVDNMVDEAHKMLEELIEVPMDKVEKSSVLKSLDSIEQMRKKLLVVDTRLADCYNILAGYNKALAEAALPQQENEVVQSEHDESP